MLPPPFPPLGSQKGHQYPLRGTVLEGIVSKKDKTLLNKIDAIPSPTATSPPTASTTSTTTIVTSASAQGLIPRKRNKLESDRFQLGDDLNIGQDSIQDSDNESISNKRRHIFTSSILAIPSITSHTPTQISSDTTIVENLPLPSPSASPNHHTPLNDLDCDKLGLVCPPTWHTVNDYIDKIEPGSVKSKALLLKLLQKADSTVLSNLYGILSQALRKDIIVQLPTEITNKIFSQFDYKTLLSASEVSKQWNLITHYSYDLWKSLLFKDKMIKDEAEFSKEFEWVKSIYADLQDAQVVKLMYNRRLGIKRDWMNPSFNPKVIPLDAQNLGVITCLQFDSDKVVAGSDQNKVVIYDTETGQKRHELLGHGGGVWAMKYYQNTLASGSTDRTVRIWNIAQGKCTHIFKGHVSTVRCLEIVEPVQCGTDVQGNPVFFPEEPLLVTGSRDTTLNVWKLPLTEPDDILADEPIELEEVDNPFLLKKLEGHSNSVRALSGYCDTIISGSYDNKAIVWDLRTFTKKYELIGHTDRIYSCVYDWKRNQCYTGSVDNTVKIWDLNRGTLKAILEGHQILVGLISASDDVLVSAAADSTVRIWDPDTGVSKHVLRGHGSAITCVENDDEKIVSGSQGSLILWNAQTGERVRNLGKDISGAVWQVKFDYRRCVVAVQRGAQTVIEIVDFCPKSQDRWVTG